MKKKHILIISIILLSIVFIILFISYINASKPDFYTNNKYFKKVGDLNEARAFHKSFLMNDGKVIIIGGYNTDGAHPDVSFKKPVDSIEIFDPETSKFKIILKDKLLNKLNTYSDYYVLEKDKIFFSNSNENFAYIYDYRKNKLYKPNLPEQHFRFALLKDKKLIAINYRNNAPIIYNPNTDTYKKIAYRPNFKYGYYYNLPDGNVCYKNDDSLQCYPYDSDNNTYLDPIDVSGDFKRCLSKEKTIKEVYFSNHEYNNGTSNNLHDYFLYDCETKQNKELGVLYWGCENEYTKPIKLKNNDLIFINCHGHEGSVCIYNNQDNTFNFLRNNNKRIFITRDSASSILLKDGNILSTGGYSVSLPWYWDPDERVYKYKTYKKAYILLTDKF